VASRRFSRVGVCEYLIVSACIALIAGVWILTLERIRYERGEAVSDSVNRNANLALGFEEFVVRVMNSVDHTVIALKYHYERYGRRIRVPDVFTEGNVPDPLVANFAIADEHGRLLFSKANFAPGQVSDREYFRVHQQRDSHELFIGTPVKGRLTGKSFIPVSRRINKRDGSFAGVAMVAIDTAYFTSFYRRVDVGREGLIVLAGLDGIPRVMRQGDAYDVPDKWSSVGLFDGSTDVPSANIHMRATGDGLPRFVSYRALDEYPLMVAIGSLETEALAGFNRRADAYYASAAAATALLAAVALMLLAAHSRNRRTMQNMVVSEARFRAIFEQATAGIVRSDVNLRILEVNQRFCEMVGYSKAELLGRSFDDITHPADVAKSHTLREALLTEQRRSSSELEKRYIRKDGGVVWVAIAASVVRDGGDADYFVTVIQDITRRKRAEQALQDSKEQFQQLAKHVPEAFWITDLKRHAMIYVSPAFEQIHGAPLRSMRSVWRAWKDTLHPEDRERALEAHRSMACGPVDVQYRIVRPDGVTRWVRACGYPVENSRGMVYRVAGTIEDITERRELESRLQYQAHFDSLTGLPNRVLFFDRLGQALTQSRRSSHGVALLFVDIDRFKIVNDTLGHHVGDKLLQHVACCLMRAGRAEDTVGRLGGDEFGIILPRIGKPEHAAFIAQKALRLLAEPLQLEMHEVVVTGSIGIALSFSDGVEAETLVRNADTAMFRAKNSGRNAYEFYTASMNERAVEQLHLERRLRRALERDEFVLHFQARTNIRTGQVTGCEALLRWSGPDGIVEPAQFVSLLEESGLIIPVGDWVVRRACRQIAEWRRAGITPMPVAVNISAKQFNQRDLAAKIETALRENDVDGSLLEVELTESTAMQNADEAIVAMGRLKALGVRIAIDDFGMGHSSLSYLKRLPIDVLKIDRSFVTGLPATENDASITKAIITMAHSLGLKVIAEGVENPQQLAFLAENGCDEVQGYLFSRPVAAGDLVGSVKRCFYSPGACDEQAGATDSALTVH
jgi:diguanylate cyclase (GGDEF)-like protein/PAS domain S-box-containing protein